MIGKTLGHYQITEKLGDGGTNIVCKVCDNHPNRFTTVNSLRVDREPAPARFLKEIRSGQQES